MKRPTARGPVRPGSARNFRVQRWRVGQAPSRAPDSLAVEEPLEVRVNGRSIAVMMRTPGHDEELAVGFLVAEGVLERREDLASVRINPRNRDGNVVDVLLEDGAPVDLARLTRHVFGASSCGLCGKASIAAVRTTFPRIGPAGEALRIQATTLVELPARMRAAQEVFGMTGGLHAAALYDVTGRMELLREDVGRHNAVDKLLGRALLDDRLPLASSVLLVSGRASFEILQKALAGTVGIVVAVGAPSSLAVEFARANRQTLVGFLRDDHFNVYSGEYRVEPP